LEEALPVLTEAKRRKYLRELEKEIMPPHSIEGISPMPLGKCSKFDRGLERGLMYSMVEVGELEELREQNQRLLSLGDDQTRLIVKGKVRALK
jgi:hypothetical protein